MKVLKFGGTSVGKPERMHSVAKLISGNDKKLVVLSAVSGTTNALVDISCKLLKKQKEEGLKAIENLFNPYKEFVKNLYKTPEGLKRGEEIINRHHEFVKSHVNIEFTEREERILLAEGELISTQLFQEYLVESGFSSVLLPALDFMLIDEDHEPVLSFTEEKL